MLFDCLLLKLKICIDSSENLTYIPFTRRTDIYYLKVSKCNGQYRICILKPL